MRYLVLGAAFAALLTSAAPTSGQSLGEVARREAERRKAVAASGKVFTNDTLRHEPLPARQRLPHLRRVLRPRRPQQTIRKPSRTGGSE